MYNILMATQALGIGGIETHIVELCRGIKEKYKNINIVVCSNGGFYEKELEQINVKHVKVPLHNSDLKNILKSYKMLKKIIKEENINIVHAHTRVAAMICDSICKKMKIPFYTTVHFDYDTKFPFNKLSKWGDKTLAVSKDLKEYVVKNYNVKDYNVYITVNGIDTNKFSKDVAYDDVIKEFKLNPNARRIMHISRLDDATIKTLEILFDMTKELYKTIENLEIVVVGDGTKFEYLKEKANIINDELGKKVIFMIGKRTTDINQFAASSTIGIGVSRSILEIMACGKPVILSGNQGYMGIFEKSKFELAYSTNFCFRGSKQVDYGEVKRDILDIFDMSTEDIDNMMQYNMQIVQNYYSKEKMVDDYINLWNFQCIS